MLLLVRVSNGLPTVGMVCVEAPLAIAKADENVEHKEGATVAEEPPRAAPALVCPDKPVSRWSEKLSFESQLEDLDFGCRVCSCC